MARPPVRVRGRPLIYKSGSHHLVRRPPIMADIVFCQRLWERNRVIMPGNWNLRGNPPLDSPPLNIDSLLKARALVRRAGQERFMCLDFCNPPPPHSVHWDRELNGRKIMFYRPTGPEEQRVSTRSFARDWLPRTFSPVPTAVAMVSAFTGELFCEVTWHLPIRIQNGG